MKFSFQTAGILIGVTLFHLFVIVALSPVESERQGSLPKMEVETPIKSLLHEVVTDLKVDAEIDPLVRTETPADSQSIPLAEHPAHSEMGDLRTTPPAETIVIDEALVPSAESFARVKDAKETPALRNDEAALEPARQIRQVRSLTPIRRS